MNTAPALEVSGLEKHYPRFGLGPLDLTVPPGSIYGLIGPNGAGKTTLIDLIFGMGSPDAGTIKVCGYDHERDEVAVKQRAAYVGPDLNFIAWGKIGRAIRFNRGFRPTWDDGYCARLMQDFGISADDRIGTLSFGGRTKLALLLALAWRPPLLVLDEPTTGIDAHSKKAVFAEMLNIVRDEARTVFISSHQISDLERFADRVGVLHKGRLVAEGSTAELVDRHVQAEWVAENADAFAHTPGLTVQERDGPHWRGVLDTLTCPLHTLELRGARDVRTQPLTLEDLFLALTQ
jgi:ABC-2 type transport system ATP-binding protein